MFAIVRGERGGLVEGALFGLLVFVGADQGPVDGFDLGDGVDDLLAEGGVGDAAVVDGFEDEALVELGTEALEQVLGDLGAEVGLDGRREVGTLAVGGGAGVVEGEVEEGAGAEALLVGDVAGGGVLVEGVGAGDEGGGLLRGGALVFEGAGDEGVVAVGEGSAAVGAEDEAGGSGAGAA